MVVRFSPGSLCCWLVTCTSDRAHFVYCQKDCLLADQLDPNNPRDNQAAPFGSRESLPEPIEENMLELEEPPVRLNKPVSESQFPDQLQRDLVQIFKLLSDETRLRVLMYLYREGELHVSAICERLQQSQPAVSHHLALLRTAGLIGCRRDGKHNFYSILQTHFHQVVAALFQTIADPNKSEFRFEDFVVTPRPRGEA